MISMKLMFLLWLAGVSTCGEEAIELSLTNCAAVIALWLHKVNLSLSFITGEKLICCREEISAVDSLCLGGDCVGDILQIWDSNSMFMLWCWCVQTKPISFFHSHHSARLMALSVITSHMLAIYPSPHCIASSPIIVCQPNILQCKCIE